MTMLKNKGVLFYCFSMTIIVLIIQIFVIINEILFTGNSVNKYLDYNKTSVNWSEYVIIPKNKQNLILVLGEARSGSSFLGDLLHQSWPTFYAYEPLFSMKLGIDVRNNETNSKKALDIITKIFECEFNKLDNHANVLWKNKRNMVMQKYPDVNDQLYWNKTLNQYVCQRCDNVLIKSIRISVKQFIELQQRFKRRINLVFNVRDPRAVMNSRYGPWMEWCNDEDINCASVEILCQRMREDLGYIQQLYNILPGMVSLVRSEDLSLKPEETAKALFEKLGLDFNTAIEEWLKMHTNQSSHPKDPYALDRQSKDVPFSWTKVLNKTQILRAEERCFDVMQLLGYNQVEFSQDQNGTFNNENILSENFELDYMRSYIN